jgi:hypothetical protein
MVAYIYFILFYLWFSSDYIVSRYPLASGLHLCSTNEHHQIYRATHCPPPTAHTQKLKLYEAIHCFNSSLLL